MELEVKMSMWLDIDEIKAIKDDAEGNYFGSSGLLMDAKAKIVKNVLEVYDRQWDIDYCHKEANTDYPSGFSTTKYRAKKNINSLLYGQGVD